MHGNRGGSVFLCFLQSSRYLEYIFVNLLKSLLSCRLHISLNKIESIWESVSMFLKSDRSLKLAKPDKGLFSLSNQIFLFNVESFKLYRSFLPSQYLL